MLASLPQAGMKNT